MEKANEAVKRVVRKTFEGMISAMDEEQIKVGDIEGEIGGIVTHAEWDGHFTIDGFSEMMAKHVEEVLSKFLHRIHEKEKDIPEHKI